MIGLEEYLQKNPGVSRIRAERLMRDGRCYFLREGHYDYALLPGSSSTDELVTVDLNRLVCECNVFRTKGACPHVAAALGLVEKNGGEIPYTDPVPHVFHCLEVLKKSGVSWGRFAANQFLWDVKPFLEKMPRKEQTEFLLELARYLQQSDAKLEARDFCDCYNAMTAYRDGRSALVTSLYVNRKECMKAVISLLKGAWHCPFTDKQKQVIVKDIAADDKLAQKYLPDLAHQYADFFPRELLIDYYNQHQQEIGAQAVLSKLLKRMVEEDPPLYEEALVLCNSVADMDLVQPDKAVLESLLQAGYGDRLGKLANYFVDRMRNLEDYWQIIRGIPREQFLDAWWNRQQKKNRGYYRDPEDWEIEVSFREDPDERPENYHLENLSCQLLGTIRRIRPEFMDETNQALRKIYRRAVKEKDRGKATEALIMLARGDDAIVVKYAANLDWVRDPLDEKVYAAVIGEYFDCMEKLFPDMKKLEVPHAAGQDETGNN